MRTVDPVKRHKDRAINNLGNIFGAAIANFDKITV